MQFFSVYDLLLNKIQENNQTLDDMYTFFKARKVKKVQIAELQQTTFIPTEKNVRAALYDYLGMTELEIELSMGRIPASYRDSYFRNIKKIAQLLSKTEDNTTSHFLPYYKSKLGHLYKGDCVKILRSMPDACVDLVFADPPFNLGKSLDNCETPFCGAGSGQYIQNKGDLPPHRSPFLYILTSPVTCFKEFRNCLSENLMMQESRII
mgnify:FL=1